jgi:uncharacterized repeat protein (TIGR01451 family)
MSRRTHLQHNASPLVVPTAASEPERRAAQLKRQLQQLTRQLGRSTRQAAWLATCSAAAWAAGCASPAMQTARFDAAHHTRPTASPMTESAAEMAHTAPQRAALSTRFTPSAGPSGPAGITRLGPPAAFRGSSPDEILPVAATMTSDSDSDSAVMPSVYETTPDLAGDVQPAGFGHGHGHGHGRLHGEYHAPPPMLHQHHGAIESCPPECRLPVAGPNPFAVGMPWPQAMLQPSPHHYPDEYLCDGGDRDLPLHYANGSREGLDTEDTVAEFVDHHGQQQTVASTKVCIYAPRFAAVRTVSLPSEEGSFTGANGVANSSLQGEMRTRLTLEQKSKIDGLAQTKMRSRASGLESERIQGAVDQRYRVQVADKILNTFENSSFLLQGRIEQNALAELNAAVQAAEHWSHEQYPILQAKVDRASIGLSEVTASAITVVDDRRSDQPAELRVVKLADRTTAEPGDEILFTIRYDNLGPNPAHHLRLVDSLTPRLQYVDDSATCDRAGQLVTQDNGEGSLVLIWEITDPVPSGEGGVVTFRARVR